MAKETEMKEQAQEIMVAVDRDLQQIETQPAAMQDIVDDKVNSILDTIFGIINDVDIEAASQRVQALREQNPTASPEELTQILIREKSKRTGTVGAVTSGTGLIPGIGTAAAMTLGVAADIGATFKLQAELVLEIAAAYNYPLTETEKQRLVMVITGISVGTTSLTQKAGQIVALKVGEKLASKAAQKSFTKALPVVGVIASAGTNVLSTYVIGQRADAYFRHGPEAVGNWSDSLRAISGVDERKIVGWLAEGGRTAGTALAVGAGKVGDAGRIAGEAISSGAGKVAESVGEGAQVASVTVRK
ncbi:MAG: DUF697 domain-containing protein, partial [Anaerolineae bacterium]|nr:DUF697 domain-containing protein [Anaerolineae bacterium]